MADQAQTGTAPAVPEGSAPPAEPSNAEQAAEDNPQPAEHMTPGPRATRLKALYGQALQHTLNKLAWNNFATCYPTISSRSENVLKQVQGQMVTKLGEKCEKEFDNIVASRQVVPKLNELETLIAEATDRRLNDPSSASDPTPPHLLPPERILSAHLQPALTSHQSQLNARLQTTQSQNAILHEEVLRQRAEIDDLMTQLEGLVADLKGANGTLADVVDQVAAESRDADAAVNGAGQSAPQN